MMNPVLTKIPAISGRATPGPRMQQRLERAPITLDDRGMRD
jgi:hypothetical protein